MIRKALLLIMICSLLSLVCFSALGEVPEETDYSWLDDLSINKLKELDAEIHKRIPYEGQTVKPGPDLSALAGRWVCIDPYYTMTDKSTSDYGKTVRMTLDLYDTGTGSVEYYNLDRDSLLSSGPFMYEIQDPDTMIVKILGLTIAFKVGEDEQGMYLHDIRDEKYIYRKVEQ